MELIEIPQLAAELILDQLCNNDVSDDPEMIEFISDQTGLDHNLVKRIVSTERPRFLVNMNLYQLDEIDWAHYGIKIL